MTGPRIVLRAFTATAAKEWAVLRRYPANFVSLSVWALFLPVVYLGQAAGFGGDDPAAVAAFADRAGTEQIAGYLYLGWAVYLWISTVLWGPGMSIRQEQLRGTLEALFTAPTSRLGLLIGPAPAHMVPATSVFATVFLALRFVFGVPIGWSEVGRGALVLLIGAPALAALGALFATVVVRFQDSDGLVQAVRGALTLLCGVTYPLAVLPSWAQQIGNLLAPTHVIDALRRAVLTDDPVEPRAVSLLAGAVVTVAVARILLHLSMRSARRTGRLGQF
jgi:ABC-2 type transport system permease protein